jgi:transcriptional regulator GlxA family with amidase domain
MLPICPFCQLDAARVCLENWAGQSLRDRFFDALHCSVLHEIVRCRLERAERLLRESELPMTRVVVGSGLSSVKAMSRGFRQHEQYSPWEYPKAHRKGNWHAPQDPGI